MKRFPSRLALGLTAALLVHAAGAATPVATVNGAPIPSSRMDVMINEQRAQGAPDGAELREAAREQLVRLEVLAQEAAKKGIDKKPEIQAQMDLARQGVLIRAYMQDFIKTNPATDADLRKEYESIKGQMGSKDKGGELGWSNPGMFVKPFSEAMVKLEKGQYSATPVKSDFGYHVIQLDDVRDLKAPPFEEVKPQLEQRLQQKKIEKHVADLRAKAKVE